MIVMGALLVPGSERRSLERMAVYLLVVTGVFFVVVELASIRQESGRVLLLAGALFVAWLKLAGIIRFSLLSRTVQLNVGQGRDIGYVRSSLIGGAFASGWTPCLGPILGSILTLASAEGDALRGAYLLGAYSLGFSVPFLLFGWVFADARAVVQRLNRYMPWFEIATALMLIGIGLLLVSGRLTALNEYFDIGLVNEGL
jgi:cytochrome c-type biogenesis protein